MGGPGRRGGRRDRPALAATAQYLHLEAVSAAGDVAQWLESLAGEGKLGPPSTCILRMVLRAALADAAEAGEVRRNPAARVPLPRVVAKPDAVKEVES